MHPPVPLPPSSADASAAGGYADFDRTLLSGAGQNTTDLSRFERGNPVMPGSYNTDIFLNNAWVGRTDVRFAAAEANASATALRRPQDARPVGAAPGRAVR